MIGYCAFDEAFPDCICCGVQVNTIDGVFGIECSVRSDVFIEVKGGDAAIVCQLKDDLVRGRDGRGILRVGGIWDQGHNYPCFGLGGTGDQAEVVLFEQERIEGPFPENVIGSGENKDACGREFRCEGNLFFDLPCGVAISAKVQ